MTRMNSIDRLRTKYKKVTETIVRLGNENKKIMAEHKNGGDIMVIGPDDGSDINLKSLKAFAETTTSSWFIYDVFVPMFLIVALLFPFQIIENIRKAYLYILGKGAMFLFSTFLLISLFRTIREARIFSEKLSYKINLAPEWEIRIICCVLVSVVFYVMNLYSVHQYELVMEGMERGELNIKWLIWTISGLIAAVSATIFYCIGLSQTTRALS